MSLRVSYRSPGRSSLSEACACCRRSCLRAVDWRMRRRSRAAPSVLGRAEALDVGRALCSTLLPPPGIQAAPQVTVLCVLRRRPSGELGHACRGVILLRRVCMCTRAFK